MFEKKNFKSSKKFSEKKLFLNEIEKTMSLLAFENTMDSPMNSLLDISHRHKTASELNSAILDSLSQEKCKKKKKN